MTTSTIYTDKDAYTSAYLPDHNNGTDSIIITTYGSDRKKIGYVGFDITSAPLAAQVSNVSLHLHRDMYESSYQNLYFRRLTETWVETSITYNDPPTYTTTNQGSGSSSTGDPAWDTYNVTQIYKDAKNAGSRFGIQIYPHSGSGASNDMLYYNTRESAYHPYIIITYNIVCNDYYVKVGGNDALAGDSWANAWATVDKGANTVPDGKTLHVGFGDYVLEPASNKIAPQLIGASGIEYIFETAGGSGGTGTVSIEKN